MNPIEGLLSFDDPPEVEYYSLETPLPLSFLLPPPPEPLEARKWCFKMASCDIPRILDDWVDPQKSHFKEGVVFQCPCFNPPPKYFRALCYTNGKERCRGKKTYRGEFSLPDGSAFPCSIVAVSDEKAGKSSSYVELERADQQDGQYVYLIKIQRESPSQVQAKRGRCDALTLQGTPCRNVALLSGSCGTPHPKQRSPAKRPLHSNNDGVDHEDDRVAPLKLLKGGRIDTDDIDDDFDGSKSDFGDLFQLDNLGPLPGLSNFETSFEGLSALEDV